MKNGIFILYSLCTITIYEIHEIYDSTRDDDQDFKVIEESTISSVHDAAELSVMPADYCCARGCAPGSSEIGRHLTCHFCSGLFELFYFLTTVKLIFQTQVKRAYWFADKLLF